MALKAFKTNDNEIVEVDDRANGTVVNLSKNKKYRNLTCVPNIGVGSPPAQGIRRCTRQCC